jgi:hypothetical protein
MQALEPISVFDPNMVDFYCIVIFGLQPEDGDATSSGFGLQRLRASDDSGCFVGGVERAEKQPDLLPGHNGDGSRFDTDVRADVPLTRPRNLPSTLSRT